MIVTRNAFAKLSGMSEGWVTKALDQGMPSDRSGRARKSVSIETATAIPWLLERAASQVKREEGSERERLAREMADGKALDNAARRGELVNVAHVRAVMLAAVSQLGAELEGVPGRMANELAAISEPAEIRARLLGQLRGVRSSYADRLGKLGEPDAVAERSVEPVKAAASKNTKPVGGRKPRSAGRKRGAGKVPK